MGILIDFSYDAFMARMSYLDRLDTETAETGRKSRIVVPIVYKIPESEDENIVLDCDGMPFPSSVNAARSIGDSRYYSGKPCKRGHASPRVTGDCTCLECRVSVAPRTKTADLPIDKIIEMTMAGVDAKEVAASLGISVGSVYRATKGMGAARTAARTGGPCRKCGSAEKSSNGQCKECRKKSDKEYKNKKRTLTR